VCGVCGEWCVCGQCASVTCECRVASVVNGVRVCGAVSLARGQPSTSDYK
jgi:hypothetical protein